MNPVKLYALTDEQQSNIIQIINTVTIKGESAEAIVGLKVALSTPINSPVAKAETKPEPKPE